MAFSDFFKASKLKAENEKLKSLMTPEMQELSNIQDRKKELEEKINQYELTISNKTEELLKLENKIAEVQNKLIILDDDILVQEFGLYTPKFDFTKADEYKERLQYIRSRQKESIKNGTASTGDMSWTVNGSISKGNKMVRDMQKLLLRAFNSECDELVDKIKYNNFDASLKKMTSSKNTISKLGTIMGIAITDHYYNLKVNELHLALEYQLKKQEEKEALKEARAQMRETAKLQKELEEQRKKIVKEQSHYQKALATLLNQLKNDPENKELLAKKEQITTELTEINISLQNIDYREANQRAGYVYVISNIGSFGENIYKIGMTRRLNPQDRIDELSDASVPFNYDIHAMIFSDDAPKLEAALHKAFDSKKLNMVNQRREFFLVTLEEIKKVVNENFDKTVEFIETPAAEQYRMSQKLRQMG